MRQVLAAFAFLTRFPLPSYRFGPADVARSMRWFPLVGLFLGLLSVALVFLLHSFVSAFVVAVLLVAVETIATGALHVDALADAADGFGGGRMREDVLRIMRDHAIGSYGGAAIALLMLWKTACLTSLVVQTNAYKYLLIIPSLGRWSTVFLSRLLPYARRGQTEEQASISSKVTGKDFAGSTIVCGLIVLPLAMWKGLFCWIVVLLVSAVSAVCCRRRLGGVTGDTLGANLQICEAAQLLLAVVLH